MMQNAVYSKSAPTTPTLLTFEEWKRLPLPKRYAPITHKELLAVQTIEAIPAILNAESETRSSAVTSPTQFFSPRLLPLIDRMAFIFSRAMALARQEADHGAWTPLEPLGATTLRPVDIMTSMEVESFCLGMQEIKDESHEHVIMRRYWRPVKGLCKNDGIGGVIAASSKIPHHVAPSFKQKRKEHGSVMQGVLIAEFEVKKNGTSKSGWWNALALVDFDFDHEAAIVGNVRGGRGGNWNKNKRLRKSNAATKAVGAAGTKASASADEADDGPGPAIVTQD